MRENSSTRKFILRALIGAGVLVGLGVLLLTGANLYLLFGEIPSRVLARVIDETAQVATVTEMARNVPLIW